MFGRREHRRTPQPLGPNYRKLFTASTISNLGDGISLIAYPWLASAVTRNPLLIALIVAAQRIPWLVFTLPAGVITDRYDRRLLMAGANSCASCSPRSLPSPCSSVATPCRRPTPSTRCGHRLAALRHVARRHVPARRLRGALRQQRPDDHAGTGRRRPSREGQRAPVLVGAGGQPVRRTTVGRVSCSPSVSRCHSSSTPGRSPCPPLSSPHHGAPATPAGRVASGHSGGQRSPKDSAGSGVTR